MINKEKLKLIPFNLLFCISTFGLILFVGIISNTNWYISMIISFVAYIYDVRITCDIEYLQNQIKENKQSKLD